VGLGLAPPPPPPPPPPPGKYTVLPPQGENLKTRFRSPDRSAPAPEKYFSGRGLEPT